MLSQSKFHQGFNCNKFARFIAPLNARDRYHGQFAVGDSKQLCTVLALPIYYTLPGYRGIEGWLGLGLEI